MKLAVAALVGCMAAPQGLYDTSPLGRMSTSSAGTKPTRTLDHGADISRDIVDATITSLPTAADLGPWEYSRALFLLGELSVYRRTHQASYLSYAQSWADLHTDEDGKVDRSVDALDFIMPGDVAVRLYEETSEERYKRTADRLAATFKTYPRTSDGAFWHAVDSGRAHQLWLDGTFMALPFIVRQGKLADSAGTADSEAVHQLLLYGAHLKDANGPLYFHAYDESGNAAWAAPNTHQSQVKWGRAIGWYCMALVDVLDALPKSGQTAKDKVDRSKLIAIIRTLARDLASFQDPGTGLWFQIVDKPALEGNFLETSASSMFTYFLDVAVKRGYIDGSYKGAAERGYRGVMSKLVKGADGHYHITDICEGTNVGDQASYLKRQRKTDDFHGLGAFVLMNEEVEYNQTIMQTGGHGK
jgi:unsaturated rhamnogalacturonyl hydrolase